MESAAEPQSPSASAIAQWIAEADGDDATARMTAITALGTAPRSDALPALQKVLNSGQTTEDRQLALQSMRTLALKHGDADGTIRNSVRQAIYHLDDAVVVTTAQEVLDQLESAPVG